MKLLFSKKTWKYIGILGIGGLFVYLTSELNNQHSQKEMFEHLTHTLTDTITRIKKENETFVYTISSLELKNADYFKKLKTKDADILELQKKIDKFTKSAAIVKTITKVDTMFVVINESGQPLFNRKAQFHINFDEWVQSTVSIAPPDSLGLKVAVKNDLLIQHKKDPQGRMYVEVQDKNPYSTTQAIRSYYQMDEPAIDRITEAITEPVKNFIEGTSQTFTQFRNRKKRFGIGPSIGYGLLFTDRGYHSGVYVGLGINYNLIRF